MLMQSHAKPFSEETQKALNDFLTSPGWETGWKSNSKTDGYTFLHKHFAGYRKTKNGDGGVYDCEEELAKGFPIISDAWKAVKQAILKDHKLVRCYANGMAYGMEGTVHTDSSKEGNYTAIYYPHDRWSPNWGGETVFYNTEESAIIGCNYPRPNSMIVFDGRIPHRANSVTRIFPGLRITLMFKTEHHNGREA